MLTTCLVVSGSIKNYQVRIAFTQWDLPIRYYFSKNNAKLVRSVHKGVQIMLPPVVDLVLVRLDGLRGEASSTMTHAAHAYDSESTQTPVEFAQSNVSKASLRDIFEGWTRLRSINSGFNTRQGQKCNDPLDSLPCIRLWILYPRLFRFLVARAEPTTFGSEKVQVV